MWKYTRELHPIFCHEEKKALSNVRVFLAETAAVAACTLHEESGGCFVTSCLETDRMMVWIEFRQEGKERLWENWNLLLLPRAAQQNWFRTTPTAKRTPLHRLPKTLLVSALYSFNHTVWSYVEPFSLFFFTPAETVKNESESERGRK